MKKQKYDERQLMARGKAYQWGCMAFIITLGLWAVLRAVFGLDAEPFGEYLLLLSVPFAVVLIVCINEDAYDPINIKPGMILFSFMPFVALFLLIAKIRDKTPLLVGKCLTEDAGLLAIYLAWVVSSIAYWIKYAKDTKAEKEDWQ